MNGNAAPMRNPYALHGSIPDLQQLQTYSVNRKGEYEGVRQTLYDFQTYAAAGQTLLQFFQVPLGQAGKTLEDTNMDQAGALPTPKYMLVESIEIYFYPAGNISRLQTGAAGTFVDTDYANDVKAVAEQGALTYFIGSKNYLQEAPLNRFPPKTCLKTEGAFGVQTKQAVAADSEIAFTYDYACFSGRPYYVNPATLLIPTQNFKVSLEWPSGVVALPSAVDGRIGIVLDGILYRQSQ